MDKQPARKTVPIIICSAGLVLLLAVILYIFTRGGSDNSGIGTLEFRILPPRGDLRLDNDRISYYLQALSEKGPGYTPDNQYVWCEIKSIEHWPVPNSITGQFGGKYYVLASNKPNEVLLHNDGKNSWTLKKATWGIDERNRDTAEFVLDKNGERLIARITGNNIGKPLCILIDGLAISAATIETRVQEIRCTWPD
jgi:hypothetical protein